MGFFDSFKPGALPEPELDDPQLGHLVWQEDLEAWQGSHNGLEFSLGYERSNARPTPELVDYASELLAGDFLPTSLETAKQKWISRDHRVSNEVRGLRIESVHLYVHRGVRRAIASLVPESEGKTWRVEFDGKTCEGLGFDS